MDELPPRSLRLTAENSAFCARVGLRFNGTICPNNVQAYNADEGWIEILGSGERRHGAVEPYWRNFAVKTAVREPEVVSALLSAAEAKRARKAARNLANG